MTRELHTYFGFPFLPPHFLGPSSSFLAALPFSSILLALPFSQLFRPPQTFFASSTLFKNACLFELSHLPRLPCLSRLSFLSRISLLDPRVSPDSAAHRLAKNHPRPSHKSLPKWPMIAPCASTSATGGCTSFPTVHAAINCGNIPDVAQALARA